MNSTARSHDRPGDVGRRIAFRRRELGLTREQLASRTGMAPEYLDYVERFHANLAGETLLALAVALETTVDVLLGAATDRPPGARTGATAEPQFRPLEAGECMQLLADGGVGRLVFVTEHGPEAVPVNFTLYDGTVVFRTTPDSIVARQIGQRVSFQVDRLDEAVRRGWSVLVTGYARQISNPAVASRLRAVVEPWVGKHRHVYMMIDPSRISGRRIGP